MENNNEGNSTKYIRRIIFAVLYMPTYLWSVTVKIIHSDSDTMRDMRAAFSHIRPQRAFTLFVLAILAVYLLSGIYMIKSGEVAVVTRFGKVVNPRVTAGLHYRLPWPLERELVVNTSEIRRESVGLQTGEPEHPEHAGKAGTLQVLSGDTNILDYEVVVQYQIIDPVLYLFTLEYEPYQIVRDTIRAAVTSVSTRTSVDGILTTDRQQVLLALGQEAQRLLDEYKSGVRIVNVNFQKAYPPEEVADSFRDVASAREDKGKAMNEAEGYRNSVVPEARGQAQKLLTEATSTAKAEINNARGLGAGFDTMLAQYQQNSRIYGEGITRNRLFLERMEQVIPRVKMYVVEPGDQVNLKLLDGGENASVFPSINNP